MFFFYPNVHLRSFNSRNRILMQRSVNAEFMLRAFLFMILGVSSLFHQLQACVFVQSSGTIFFKYRCTFGFRTFGHFVVNYFVCLVCIEPDMKIITTEFDVIDSFIREFERNASPWL